MRYLAFITCNHQREDVLRLYLEGVDRLRYQTNIPIVSIVVGDANSVAKDYDCTHVVFPNDSLTDRFNKAFEVARNYNPSHVMIMGSDNTFDINLLNEMDKRPESNFIAVRDIYFTALDSIYKGETIYILSSIIGCCRLMTAEILDKVNWKPFNRPANRGIDTILYRCLQPHFVNPYIFVASEFSAKVIDYKNSFNLNTFDKWAKMPRVDTNEALDFLSDKEKEIYKNILFSNK